jgi:dTMP kinase
MAPSRGTFIVLDGTEGSGKSTQARMLHERLAQGLGPDNVLLVRDPGTTRIGEQVRSLLLNPDHAEMNMRCEMLLYMAARAQMMAQTILPALAQSKVVVCDRFVSSTLAYQLGGDELTAGDIVAVADIAVRGRWPDLTLLLDMPARSSMARVNREKDRIEQRPLEYHEQVRKNYLAQAERDPERYQVIPAERDVQEVHEQVFSAAWKQVASHRNQR